MSFRFVIIGGSGALGSALADRLTLLYPTSTLYSFSRKEISPSKNNIVCFQVKNWDEESISRASHISSQDGPLKAVLVATGFLQNGVIMPEKSLKDLSSDKFQYLFYANTILPALVAKHFITHLTKEEKSFFAALSARVGSISDNRLGGWYAYRSSKAALNMILKNTAIELSRTNKNGIVVGLHPGTVKSPLSRPFQKKVPGGKLFSPEYSAQKLLEVLGGLTPDDSGKCFAWDGQEIDP